jgi:hypothetical protein
VPAGPQRKLTHTISESINAEPRSRRPEGVEISLDAARWERAPQASGSCFLGLFALIPLPATRSFALVPTLETRNPFFSATVQLESSVSRRLTRLCENSDSNAEDHNMLDH